MNRYLSLHLSLILFTSLVFAEDFIEQCKNGGLEDCKRAIIEIEEQEDFDLIEIEQKELFKIINKKGYLAYKKAQEDPEFLDQSIEYFKLGCKNHNSQSCTALLYFSEKSLFLESKNIDIEEDLIHINNKDMLLQDYKHLCENANESVACNNAGVLILRNAKKGDDNEKIAYNYLESACYQGSGWGCYNLAFLSLRTLEFSDMPRDEAEEYFQEACGLGIKEACFSQEEIQKFRIEANSGFAQWSEEITKLIASLLSGTAGAIAGATVGTQVGATIGTAIAPAAGTAAGAAVGGVVGGVAGEVAGDKIGIEIFSNFAKGMFNNIPEWDNSDEKKFRSLILTKEQLELFSKTFNGFSHTICLTQNIGTDQCYMMSRESFIGKIDKTFQYRTIPMEESVLFIEEHEEKEQSLEEILQEFEKTEDY